MILLAGLIGLTAALNPLSHLGFRDDLQALLRNFDIAREQFQRVAGHALVRAGTGRHG